MLSHYWVSFFISKLISAKQCCFAVFLAYPLQAARLVAPNRAKARLRRFRAPSGAARKPWAVWSCVLAAAQGGTHLACAPVLRTPQRSSVKEHFRQRLLCTDVTWEELGRRALDSGEAARRRDTSPGEGLRTKQRSAAPQSTARLPNSSHPASVLRSRC